VGAVLWAACAAGIAACSGSRDATAPSGTGSSSLLVVAVQPFRFGTIGVCNQFQLWVTAADATGNVVAVDSTQWTSSDSTTISVGPGSGLLTSRNRAGSVTITATAWGGGKFGAGSSIWVASPFAVQLLDPNGNPYPEPPCP
jgi:hypothetical protein